MVRVLSIWALSLLSISSLLAAPGAPRIVQVTPAAGQVGALTNITVVFSEPVIGVAPDDLLVNTIANGGTVSGSGTTYTFTLDQQPPYGTVTISWDEGHSIVDVDSPAERFDQNGAGATWQYTLVDSTAPAIASLTPATGAGVRQLTQVEVLFTEPVTGVDATDLLINNSPATGVSVSGSGKYVFTFPQPTNGTVQLAWATGHGIRDFAGAANAFAGGSWSYTLDPNLGVQSIRINEFVAANIRGLSDFDTPPETNGWIEIWNYGAAPVNLNGFSLTDDRDDPGRWVFPSTNIAPGQFLIVYASGKDRTNGLRLHTNFQLGKDGEYLGLFNAESPRVAITEFGPYPAQRNDISYGYDSTNALKYFATPTPGAANGTSAITGTLPPPHFNVERGYFERPFTLILGSPTPGATILYTTDGSEPTAGAANVLTYSDPITVDKTTVFRAAAFKTGMLPSAPVTQTYLFLDQVVHQPNRPAGFPTNWGPNTSFPGGVVPADYEMDQDVLRVDPLNTNSAIDSVKMQRLKDGLRELPVLSIVMKTDDIFGTAGLYQRSAIEGGAPGSKPKNKKPCSVEMILPDGTTAFATTCGIDLHGNASRNPIKNPKHGFKLKFKDDYGQGALNYRLFEDSTIEEFDDILLRPDFNSSWRHWSNTDGQGLGARQRERAARIRDAWMKNSQRDMGGLAGNSRFVHLYLNGLYWGTFDITQQPVETFAKSALGDSGTGFDVVDQGSVQVGNLVAYNAMLALPAATTLSNYNRYFDYLNIPEFADYMLLHFYMGHQDWSTDQNKNWYAMRKRVSGPEGTFRYLAWDGECILLNEDVNRVTVTTPPSMLHTRLDDSPEYRLAFADRVHKHMIAPGGALTPAMTRARWDKWQAVMDKPIVAESARWGDYRRDVHQYSEPPYQLYTREAFWVPENARMARYFSNRTATVLGQLVAANMYPRVSAPVFSQQGGRVARGFGLTMTATNTIYFTTDGSDPRVFGTGAVSPTAQTYSTAVSLPNSMIVKARVLAGTNWSALNEASFQADTLSVPLRVTEIMYNPIGGDAYEYIELQNVGSVPLNVGNFSLEGISYLFPPNTILAAGATIVLGSDISPVNWNSRYPGVSVFGRFDMNLGNGGEKIAIRDAAGNVVYSVDYDDENGWPTQPDGGGFSLQVVDVFGDPDDPANWRASASQNGTPGTQVGTPASGPVVINEVMAENITAVANGNTRPDWIELYNSGASAVNIGGWSLTDDGNPRKFVFPAGTSLPANGYLVVWCDAVTNTTPGLHTGFALGRNGESVFLYNASTTRVDSVTFGLQLADLSVGRVANVWRLTTPTPNAANQAATLGSSTNLVINEWLADATPGGADWVELYNRSTSPVSLQGVYVANGEVIFQIASLSFVPPGGFVQLFADEVAGADHLDFKLAAAGGAIVLYDEAGNQQDSVTYTSQAQGVTQGRLPDGSSTIVAFPASPSPGASNYQLNYAGARLNEVMAINESAVTNSGRTPDWVELYNPNASAFALGGMGLTTDADEPAQWVFPAGTTVPGNGYLVVWFDDSRAATTNAGAFLNTGRSLDGDSGEVHLVSTNGQVVDSIVYGFQVADLSIGFATPAWTLLASPTPGAANSAAATLGSAANLRINEWMADPSSGNDWFEVYNNSDQAVALEGVSVADTPALPLLTQSPFAPVSFIGPRGFIKCVADADVSQGRNHTTFSLDASGEALQIYSESLGVIDTVYFGQQMTDASEGRLPDGGDLIVPFASTASPSEPNYLPLPRVVINEVLTHTDDPLEDAIELRNPGAIAADIGGYYLSDNARNLKKYRVPAGTIIPASGFKVIYQNDLTAGAGALAPFTFDSVRGDAAYLSATDAAGNLTGYRAVAKFGPAANGVSFGRFPTTLGVDYPALSQRSYGVDNPSTVTQFRTGAGAQNAYPAIGPIVLNELAYHPPDVGTNDNTADEYIEVHNVTTSAVTLYDIANPANTWRIRGGVDFDFPGGVTIGSRGFALIVSFNPTTNTAALNLFRATYGIPTSVPIFGPFRGKLENGGESVELYRPDTPQGPGPDAGYVPYLLTDKVEYGDESPWPFEADGGGASLQRRRPYEYGNEPVNWKGDGPTPGRPNVSASTYVDADSDGLSDAWESQNGLNSGNAADANQDADGDGETNGQEFLAGTDPRSGASVLAAPAITSHPASSTVVGGEDATFTVAATGSSPLSYKWRFNGRDVPDATGPTLSLSEVQRADAGQYDAVVMNSHGFAISQPATLTVNIPPRFTLNPQSVTINNSNNVTFTVAAVGTGTLRYKWQFNGSDIPGATGTTLSLTNIQVHHSGQYTAVVTDDIGSVTSQPATLDVRMRPYFIDGPVSQTVVVGGTATFSVRVAGSTPIGYNWRRNNSAFTNIVLFDTNCTITLNNVQTNQAGTYAVVITNAALVTPGLLSPGLATLTVLFPPYITAQPTNQTVEAGTNVVLSVRANGNPPPAYQWLLNGGLIPGATSADLSLTSIQPEQAGNYSVLITNSAGSVTSAIATVTVGGPGALRLEIGRTAPSSVVLRVNAVADASYTIEYQDALGTGQWQLLQNISAGPARLVEINDPAAGGQRFYRLRTPALP